jgi:hypothetical protein
MNGYEQRLEDMECGDSIEGSSWQVTRVPGGWIYHHKLAGSSVYVPMPGMMQDEINLYSQSPIEVIEPQTSTIQLKGSYEVK